MKQTVWVLLMLGLLVACEPEPTPFPVDVPVTPTPTPEPTPILPVRYALAPNTQGLIEDFDVIQASAEVEQLFDGVAPNELGTRFDVVATYGEFSGWSQSEANPHAMLIINPETEPLDAQFAYLISLGIDPTAIVEAIDVPGISPADSTQNAAKMKSSQIRSDMANLGRPDGFRLGLGAAFIPGARQVADHLETINIETRITQGSNDQLRDDLTAGRIHLALVSWTSERERAVWHDLFGVDYAIDLYTVPISYLATPELSITFTDGGWPIASR